MYEQMKHASIRDLARWLGNRRWSFQVCVMISELWMLRKDNVTDQQCTPTVYDIIGTT